MRKKLLLLLLGLLFSSVNVKPTNKILAEENTPPINPPSAVFGKDMLPTDIDISFASDLQLSEFYEGIDGKRGDDILSFLNTKINGHREYNYNSSSHRNIYKIIDRNWEIDPLDEDDLLAFNYTTDNGFIHKLYADYNDDINTADRFKNEGKTRVSFDKEHIWAQSLGDFGRTGGAGSDFHALWPSDVVGNQTAHSNYNFGEPTSNIREVMNDYGTYVGRFGNIDGYSHKVFEPLDQYKGDIARAMFYMPARYYQYENKLKPRLSLVYGSPDAVVADEDTPGLAGNLETLLEWNELDPVDEYEIRRNNLIANNYQGNRNPFIDYPQWARIAYETNYNGPAASAEEDTSSMGSASDPFSNLELEGISLNLSNVKTEYFLGDPLDIKGIGVTGLYSGENTRLIKDYSTNIAHNSTLVIPGQHEIIVSVSHGNITLDQSFEINVQTNAIKDFLMITQVYAEGGNSQTKYKQDFVEIYNDSTEAIDLGGKSFQYTSGLDSDWHKNRLILHGKIEAKSHFLIALNEGKNDIKALPTGDITTDINLVGSNIKIALVNSTIPLVGTNPSSHHSIIDFLGAGSKGSTVGVNGYLGQTFAEGPTKASATMRKTTPGGIYINTNDNNNDFMRAEPMPRNTALSIAYDIMKYSDVNSGHCLILYEPFKLRVMDLSPDFIDEEDENNVIPGQLSYFQNDVLETKMVEGRARYEAWATFNDNMPYEWPSQSDTNHYVQSANSDHLIIIVSAIGLMAFGFYLVVLRKKENSY